MSKIAIKAWRVYAGKDPRINLPWPHCVMHLRVTRIARGVVYTTPAGGETKRTCRHKLLRSTSWLASTFAAWAVAEVTP